MLHQTALILSTWPFGSKLWTESLSSTSCSVNPSLGPMDRLDLERTSFECMPQSHKAVPQIAHSHVRRIRQTRTTDTDFIKPLPPT